MRWMCMVCPRKNPLGTEKIIAVVGQKALEKSRAKIQKVLGARPQTPSIACQDQNRSKIECR